VNGEFETNLLFVALESGLTEIVLRLLKLGGSPNSRDGHGRTVLWRALELKSEELFLKCLEHEEADVSVQDKFGCTLAHVALETGQLAIGERIIRTGGVAIDAVDGRKRTALRRALELKSDTVALACLDAGATTTAADPTGQLSVVHLALQNFSGDTAVSSSLAIRLIKAGSLVSAQDAKGFTVLARVADQGRDDCLYAGLVQILKPLGSYKAPCKKAAAWIMSGQENTDVRQHADCLVELPEKVKALDPGLDGTEAEAAVTQLLAGTTSQTALGLSAKELITRIHNPTDPEPDDDEPKPKKVAAESKQVPDEEEPEAKQALVAESPKAKSPKAASPKAKEEQSSSSAEPEKQKEPPPIETQASQPSLAEGAPSPSADYSKEFDDFEDDFEED
jgi:hypothetical protein